MAARIYDDDIYAFARRPQHYWAATASAPPFERVLDRDITSDVVIIGGGYTGLWAAHRLASQHGIGATVLEAGACIGWGASGANGGFVSFGGVKLELAEMVARAGEAETRRYWDTQAQAITAVRTFIADEAPECEAVGDGDMCVAHRPSAAAPLQEEAVALKSRYGVDAEFLTAEQFRAEAHDGPETYGALRLRLGFGMHPFRLVNALAQRAVTRGVQVFTSSEVIQWQRESSLHLLVTRAGHAVRCKRVIIATNGYTPDDLMRSLAFRSLPAISSIIVTQAYGDAEIERRGFRTLTPIYNSRNLLSYYRRLPGGRILFGRRGDLSGTAEAERTQANAKRDVLSYALPAFEDARVDYHWRGLVSLTARRSLAVGLDPDDKSVAFAFGCHGSGTAAMASAGTMAADLVAGSARVSDVPALFRDLPPKVPRSAFLRRLGLRAAYSVFRLKDALP